MSMLMPIRGSAPTTGIPHITATPTTTRGHGGGMDRGITIGGHHSPGAGVTRGILGHGVRPLDGTGAGIVLGIRDHLTAGQTTGGLPALREDHQDPTPQHLDRHMAEE